ncbi:MAG: hypothetical protein ACREV6_24290 [Clostridium sp.]|uniref:hypothetical protein n=1 Tax=Clostridium sp. TaxID=1506 RepID=UPI003D6C9593
MFGGFIINKLIKLIRSILVILSCLLLSFSIFAWVSGLRISDSELLPIIASSNLAMLLFFIYWALGMGSIKSLRTPENKIIRILSKVGFGGNIVLTILSILTIIGFGIMP